MEGEREVVDVPTVDLGSEAEARACQGRLEGTEGVRSMRIEGNRVILSVATEAAQNVHCALYAAGLRPWNSTASFKKASV